MSAIVKTWIPAPNWDIPATSPSVVLGSIIKDPKNPETRINRKGPVPVPTDKVLHGEKRDWRTTSSEVRGGKLGLWAQCLQIVGLGGDVSFSRMKTSLEDYKFDHLETMYFLPDEIENYMDESVYGDYVQAYFEATGFRQPVFMITGIKIARGSVVETTAKKENGGEGKVGVDLTALGAPVTLGPEGTWKNDKERVVWWGGSTDYVFAYQLKRIKCKRGGSYDVKDFNKGAVFGKDDDEQEENLEQEYDIVDYDGDSFGISDTLKEVTE